MNWTLQIAFHYPHDRFLLGWEYMAQTKEQVLKMLGLPVLEVYLKL